MTIKSERITLLKKGTERPGPIVYWMSRDQRAHDNWALLFAFETAVQRGAPLFVIFCLADNFPGANLRHYAFMLRGLGFAADELHKLNIPFFLIQGEPEDAIPAFLSNNKAGALVTDFDPLRVKRLWKRRVMERINIPVYEVDAHNIVPCRFVSNKQEYGAYTLRPKINKILPGFMDAFPKLKIFPGPRNNKLSFYDWDSVANNLKTDRNFIELKSPLPGAKAAHKALDDFLSRKINIYASKKNDPNCDAVSGLSPYLHFGHIAAQRAALEIMKAPCDDSLKASFIEELVVRRELSDNFCFFNDHYDDFEGFPRWAKETLNAHRGDKREYIYTLDQFEGAQTHDPLWNGAQFEMVRTGRMHGYMRMYWAKKILEWSESPEQAQEFAIFLNDRYELDGRDPNGYTGIAWSIGGVHDRAWKERPVFGKIRYMNFNGCKSKFDTDLYINKYTSNK